MNKRLLLAVLPLGILSGFFGAWVFVSIAPGLIALPQNSAPASAPLTPTASVAALDTSRANLRDAADRIIPSVVSVRAFGGPALGVSSGSGVIISDDGMVATNHHVVEGAGRIRVTLFDRTEHWAKMVGADENTDLALLRIDAGKKVVAARFGNSDELQTGQWLLAVGNPFGLRSTVTAGILSARGRRIGVLGAADRIESFLQTDAAVNPGSSGGALVNARGELVGINTAMLSESGRHEGFNFAIPGNLARRVLEDLRDYGRTRRATIGAYVQTATPSITRQAGLKEAVGVQITELVPGGRGPARRSRARRHPDEPRRARYR